MNFKQLIGKTKRKLAPYLIDFAIYIATARARWYLMRNGPIKVLVDNSAIGHGVTHETVWIDTGKAKWGGCDIDTGYQARVPVHSQKNDTELYSEITHLIGITELAREGLIEFYTSAELQSEKHRQPTGRYAGYQLADHNIFDGISIPSIDGLHYDYAARGNERQQSRLRNSSEEPFKQLAHALPDKDNQDAWHIHTAHANKLDCFLHLDLKLNRKINSLRKQKKMPDLDTEVSLPSDLAAKIGLHPIPPLLISFRNAPFFVRPDLTTPLERRQSMPKRQEPETEANAVNSQNSDKLTNTAGVIKLPTVAKINGLGLVPGREDTVNIQYEDSDAVWHEISMPLKDAIYLLSLLKSLQLNLEIPFPDVPRGH